METSDGVKTALRQEAEANVLKLLRSLQEVKKGDLKGLEEQVMETVMELGRGWMESILSGAEPEERATQPRVGSCGHPQQLVGYRPKQVLTLMGKITFRRAYYQCVREDGGHPRWGKRRTKQPPPSLRRDARTAKRPLMGCGECRGGARVQGCNKR